MQSQVFIFFPSRPVACPVTLCWAWYWLPTTPSRAFRPVAVRLSSGGDCSIQRVVQRTIRVVTGGMDVGGVVDRLVSADSVLHCTHNLFNDIFHFLFLSALVISGVGGWFTTCNYWLCPLSACGGLRSLHFQQQRRHTANLPLQCRCRCNRCGGSSCGFRRRTASP